jgi:hypothetical protein
VQQRDCGGTVKFGERSRWCGVVHKYNDVHGYGFLHDDDDDDN